MNYKGRIKPYVNKNLLLDAEKIKKYIIPLLDVDSRQKLEKITNSDITMLRVKKISDIGIDDVYNLTIDTKEEKDHNFVVFTKKFTPLIIKNCHAAIVSREMGIPAIVGTEKATQILKDGQLITVDAYHGLIYPGETEIEKPEEVVETEEETPLEFEKSITTSMKVNVAFRERVEEIAKKVDGVGLLRIEHMITKAGIHPAKLVKENRAEEYIQILLEGIRPIAKAFHPKPVWVRTLDARSDEFRNLEGGAEEPEEDNPMLGWHGIRRSLDEPDILKAEFEAIKRLHEEGLTNVHIMLPFVISVEEFRDAREIAKEINLPETVKIGIMAESHAAVKKMIKYVIKVCKSYEVESSVCGEAPSNIPQFVEFLVRCGIDSISANIDAIDKVRNTVIRTEKKLLLEALREKS